MAKRKAKTPEVKKKIVRHAAKKPRLIAVEKAPIVEKPKRHMAWWQWLLASCLVFVVIVIIVGIAMTYLGFRLTRQITNEIGDKSSQKTITNLQGAGERANLTPPVKVGEPVSVNGLTWTVTKARIVGTTLAASDASESLTADLGAQNGRFVSIELSVKNDDTIAHTPSSYALLDHTAKEYSFCFRCAPWLPKDNFSPLLEAIAPGDAFNFTVYYDVPRDSTGLTLRIGNLGLLDDDEAYVNLGLE